MLTRRALVDALLFLALPGRAACAAARRAPAELETVRVFVDATRVSGVSRFQTGVTHTRYSLDTVEGEAKSEVIARGKTLLGQAAHFHNVHLMGWGTMNPNPAPAVYDWASLDKRMAMVRSTSGAVPVITLCAAPDWIKGGEPGKTDWSKIEVAPVPEHYQDFADLAAVVARRYPDVRYFQVWNEFKGLWNAALGNWDYEKYTRLYNGVYDALKAVNSQIKVGGPYLVIEGTGGNKGPAGDATGRPLSPRNQAVLDYWLRHKRGADFVVLDRSVKSYHDKNTYSTGEVMALTHWFGDVAHQVRAKTDLPVWWAEYYADVPEGGPAALAAAHASALGHMVRNGVAAALLWQPMATGEVPHALFTDARQPDNNGARPLPYWHVLRAFHVHFGPGARLVRVTVSNPVVEALASAQKTLLINKRAAAVAVCVNNAAPVTLAGYDVRLINTPPNTARSK